MYSCHASQCEHFAHRSVGPAFNARRFLDGRRSQRITDKGGRLAVGRPLLPSERVVLGKMRFWMARKPPPNRSVFAKLGCLF